jgi:hypothetical protein
MPCAVWSKHFDSEAQVSGHRIVADADGGVLLSSSIKGSVNFGGAPLTSGPQSLDLTAAKLDAAGNVVWSKLFKGTGDHYDGGIAIDGEGHFVLSGSFDGTIDFGGGALVSDAINNIFVAKLGSAAAGHLWSKRFPGSANSADVAVAADGHIVVAGAFSKGVDFGGGPLASANPGTYEIFLAALDEAGDHLWSESFGGAGFDLAGSVAVDGAGNVLLAGIFEGVIDFGGGALSAMGSSAFVARFDPLGKHIWSKSFGDGHVWQMRVDPAGSVTLIGGGKGMDFGGGPLTDWNFVAKLDAAGNHLWSRSFGQLMVDSLFDADTDASGNVFLTGFVSSPVDLGGGPLAGDGQGHLFVAKLDSDGNHVWSSTFGHDASGLGVAADAAGNVIVRGELSESVDFGLGPLTRTGVYQDFFVVKFIP